jgi:hypothetical protein
LFEIVISGSALIYGTAPNTNPAAAGGKLSSHAGTERLCYSSNAIYDWSGNLTKFPNADVSVTPTSSCFDGTGDYVGMAVHGAQGRGWIFDLTSGTPTATQNTNFGTGAPTQGVAFDPTGLSIGLASASVSGTLRNYAWLPPLFDATSGGGAGLGVITATARTVSWNESGDMIITTTTTAGSETIIGSVGLTGVINVTGNLPDDDGVTTVSADWSTTF